MIAHKSFKVIVGIMLVVLLISTSVMSSFASEDIDLLDGFPYILGMSWSTTSDGSYTFSRVIPYRDGNNFWFPNEPYIRNLQFQFFFSDYTQFVNGNVIQRPSASGGAVSTTGPYNPVNESLVPVHIDSIVIKGSIYASQFHGGGDTPVNYDDILLDDTNFLYWVTGSDGSDIIFDRMKINNPFTFEYYNITGGLDDCVYLGFQFRLSGYPQSSIFAPDICVRFDQVLINGYEIAVDHIATEANNEMSSIYQRLSDYSLEHLTEVDLNDILNNVDNASNSVEDVRFLSIFDGIYGYGIIPTLITLSLCISFVGYLLFGKSG